MLLAVTLLTCLHHAAAVVDCRFACRSCREKSDLAEILEVYCAMCNECKERRVERMQAATTTTTVRDDCSDMQEVADCPEPPSCEEPEEPMKPLKKLVTATTPTTTTTTTTITTTTKRPCLTLPCKRPTPPCFCLPFQPVAMCPCPVSYPLTTNTPKKLHLASKSNDYMFVYVGVPKSLLNEQVESLK